VLTYKVLYKIINSSVYFTFTLQMMLKAANEKLQETSQKMEMIGAKQRGLAQHIKW